MNPYGFVALSLISNTYPLSPFTHTEFAYGSTAYVTFSVISLFTSISLK